MARSEGTLTVTLDDVVGGDTHTVAMNRNQATRGGETLQQDAVIVFALRDGRVSEAGQFFDDTARNDACWGQLLRRVPRPTRSALPAVHRRLVPR